MQVSMQCIATAAIFCIAFIKVSLTYRAVGFNEFDCKEKGYFPHPQDRQKFYSCVSAGIPSQPHFTSYTYTCDTKLCYDTTLPEDDYEKCSKEACSKNETKNDDYEYACLKAHLQQDAQKICEDETLTSLGKQFKELYDFTSVRGSTFSNFLLSVRDVNIKAREYYGKMIENVGKNIYPLMVATDGEPDYLGVGGVFKIYFKDGSMRRIVPTSPTFEIHKSLSHIVLGIFAIISPYFQAPQSTNWRPGLLTLQQTMRDVLHLLDTSNFGEEGEINKNFPSEQKESSIFILRRSIAYIDQAIKTNSVEMSEFKKFGNALAPFIEKSMTWAAEAHAQDTIPALQKLKEEMGEEEWRKMHVIIPTVWPVSLYNIRLQALEKVMSFEQIKNQVLLVEGASSEAAAKTTLGRVVADRVVAQLVWGGLEQEAMKDHVFSLSTRRDLVSSPAAEALNKACKKLEKENKPKCPFAGRYGDEDEQGINYMTGMPMQRRFPGPATMLRS